LDIGFRLAVLALFAKVLITTRSTLGKEARIPESLSVKLLIDVKNATAFSEGKSDREYDLINLIALNCPTPRDSFFY